MFLGYAEDTGIHGKVAIRGQQGYANYDSVDLKRVQERSYLELHV